MKKIQKTVLAIAVAAIALSSAACGGKPAGNQGREGYTQIYVAVNSDGFVGLDWLNKSAEKFNEIMDEQDVKYEVIVQDGEFNILGTLGDQINSGYSEYSIYFGGQAGIVPLIEQGMILDVSDVYKMTAPGDTKPIKERMLDYEGFTASFKNLKGEGIYAVPYTSAIFGLVFDYEYFLERGYLYYADVSELGAVNAQENDIVAAAEGDLLVAEKAFGNYDAGEYILSKGKDGKYGTYDDGQAVTMEEFEEIISRMLYPGLDGKRDIPFIYTNQYAKGYTTPFMHSIMAQYMGYDNYYNFLALKGDIKDVAGNVQLTLDKLEKGKDAFETEVVKTAYEKAAQFFYDYVMGKAAEIGDVTDVTTDKLLWENTRTGNSFSHKAAQNHFVQAYKASLSGIAQPAFLFEGSYWENEAKATMQQLDEGRKYGQREYRIYLLPAVDGQISENNETVFAGMDTSNGVLLNNYPKNIRDKGAAVKTEFMNRAKQFLAMTMSEEMCVYYTKTTGLRKPFAYELSAEDQAELTPFQRNVFEMLSDTENIKTISVQGISNLSPVRCYGLTNIVCETYEYPYVAFKTGGKTPATWVKGVMDTVDDKFGDYLSTAEGYLNK